MANTSVDKQTNLDVALFGLTLDRDAGVPLHRQLAEALRALILSGHAAPGARLPASRQLAAELSVSRMTAMTALEQLVAEGYLETRQGAGTFVAHDLPHLASPRMAEPDAGPTPPPPQPYLPFQPAIPDLAEFPHALWARHLDRVWRNPEPNLLARPDPMGWPPLRQAIANHLKVWRGIDCGAGQVMITSGATEAFELIARALLAKGDSVLIEDPGFAPMRDTLVGAGMAVCPCAVDEDGFDIERAAALHGPARAAIVTPSRHYPLGMTMPLARRLALLDWAAQSDALVVEDDYDSEFRYRGQPLPAMMSLDQVGRTIYIGSFSKLLSPALRLGYLVVPPGLLPRISDAAARLGARASLIPQPALAAFMDSGEFAVHLRRMRRLYAARQQVLREALAEALPDHLICPPDPGGMHLVCDFGPALAGRVRDATVAEAARAEGLTLRALSAYATLPGARQGLALGYAGFDEDTLRNGVTQLARVLRRY